MTVRGSFLTAWLSAGRRLRPTFRSESHLRRAHPLSKRGSSNEFRNPAVTGLASRLLKRRSFYRAQPDIDLLIPLLVRCRRRRRLALLDHRCNGRNYRLARIGQAIVGCGPVVHHKRQFQAAPVIRAVFNAHDDLVTLGKRLGAPKYVGCERGVNPAAGAFRFA
jgi:hypothetical protein